MVILVYIKALIIVYIQTIKQYGIVQNKLFLILMLNVTFFFLLFYYFLSFYYLFCYTIVSLNAIIHQS